MTRHRNLRLVICLAALCASCRTAHETAFEGESTKLRQTQIVATLDTPMAPGKNVIWCAAFQCAWKALQKDVVGEPIKLAGGGALVASLNNADDPSAHIPDSCIYRAAGWVADGILAKIRSDMKSKFPGREPPELRYDSRDGAAVAYAYLGASSPFGVPYDEVAMSFADGAGKTTMVDAFGMRAFELRERLSSQPCLLFSKIRPVVDAAGMDAEEIAEFAVDLDRHSSPHQIVVASIPRTKTLADAYQHVQHAIAAPDNKTADVDGELLVPKLRWRIIHRFAGLEGRAFENESRRSRYIEVAREDITFRLDHRGAELEAEAVVGDVFSSTPSYVFKGPFLVYMKARGADVPYFVMWVENDELLLESVLPEETEEEEIDDIFVESEELDDE